MKVRRKLSVKMLQMSDGVDDMFVELLPRNREDSSHDFDYDKMVDDESDISNGAFFIENESTVYDEISEISDDGLDLFLTKLYRYYLKKGYWNIVLSQLTQMLIFTFFVLFCIFIFGAIDYHTLFTYRDPSKTYQFSDVIHISWLKNMNAYFIISLIIFVVYVCWKTLRIVYDAKVMWRIHNFYKYDLQITDFELQTLRWTTVVKKLNNFIQLKGYEQLEPWNISARIMKKDNYLIAMIHHHTLKYGIRLLPESMNNGCQNCLRHCYSDSHNSNDVLQLKIFSRVLLWSITYCVVNFIVNERNEVRNEIMFSDREHIQDNLKGELKKKFRIIAALNFLLIPFLALFVPVYTLFRYGEEFYKNPSSAGNRDWGFAAKWKFREYNELPHIFKSRMHVSSKYADQYISQFPFGIYENAAKLLTFVSSSFIVYFIFISVINENALFNVDIFQYKSLFWCIGVLSTVWVVSRSILKEQSIFYPEKKMEKLSRFLHYIPDVVKLRPNSIESVGWVKKYFKFRIVQLLEEIVSIFTNPFVLWFCLGTDESINRILTFVRESTIEHSRLGKICEYSVFEIDQERDTILKESDLEAQRYVPDLSGDKKLEQSIAFFNQTKNSDVAGMYETDPLLYQSDVLASELETVDLINLNEDQNTLFQIISQHKPSRF